MASLQNLLSLGQLYVSFNVLKDNIEDWSTQVKFYFIVAAKDTSRVICKCKDNTCDWRLRANKQADNSIKIICSRPVHNSRPLMTELYLYRYLYIYGYVYLIFIFL